MTMVHDDLVASPPAVPTVLIGEQIEHSKWPCLAIDNVAAAREVTTYLIEQGHRRIAALGAYHGSDYRNSSLRLEGYRAAVADAGLATDEDLIIYTDKFSREAGLLGVGGALAAGLEFDAIFCFTDLLAFGALRALADAGMKTPDDVAIASIDDIEEAAYSVPSLTTIAPDKDAIVDGAVTALLGLIAGEVDDPDSREVAYRLVVRESSQPLHRQQS